MVTRGRPSVSLAAESSVVHHGNDCNVQRCAICPCELPAVYHTAALDRCALVSRWKVWETGALDGECGGAAHIHATAGMFCTKAEQTSSTYFICIAFGTVLSLFRSVVHVLAALQSAISRGFPSELLQGGETADYIGAVRVFGIGDKMLFEQLTSLDNREMTM